ncbi:hypothetical protein [Streptomyces sp. NBC_01637]|uniref:hypothetical protein n=1 Tax=unclassified Streptomyces TaxID=2593676 RepID=UPI00386E1AE6|nr:hypothetical protein OH719_08370 [Streptomyces sp. NBC_01653]WTD92983.1 hypothetical protein OG891_38500 [Streptomyces sp. NBC_01637]
MPLVGDKRIDADLSAGPVRSSAKKTPEVVDVFYDSWVITSFNWLSFRGDPERTYRMEEGSLVRIRQIADIQYARYLELIDGQRR